MISPEERAKDTAIQKIEFYLMVYFTIYPIHPVNPARDELEKLAEEMKHFKIFIETKGAQLSKTPEFLSFYALPYIKNLHVLKIFLLTT